MLRPFSQNSIMDLERKQLQFFTADPWVPDFGRNVGAFQEGIDAITAAAVV
jgi:hypothetical protein